MGQKTSLVDLSSLEIDRKQLKELQRRFLELNDKRKQLLTQNLGDKENALIELLPFLFHINHPTLPGYVGADAPCGVANYQPEKSTIQLAKKYAKSLDYKPRAVRQIEIEGIYLMGSAGSVAHSMQSDFDVWVCCSEDLSPERKALLRDKRAKIQSWAEELAIDCSIYLVQQSKIIDSTAENEKETIQNGLLLDEFYRTQVYLAGRYLLWWLVPPEWEHAYAEYTKKLISARFVQSDDWIDFGAIPEIPREEYINNALWYINKALESPYKTALKLVLMESYLSQYPNVKPLSNSYKIFVHNLIDNATVIDAYLLMHRKVEEYLILNDQFDRLEFVRRCLYQKINYRLGRSSATKHKAPDIVKQLIEEWGWSDEKRKVFDNRAQWDINQIGNEKRLYIKQLITSFRTIGQFLKQDDAFFEKYKKQLQSLSRKISANLELTQGKIERVNINFVPKMTGKHLSLVRQTKGKEFELWSFYDRAISQQESNSAEPVYQCRSLLELLAWAKTNGLLNEDTSVQYRDSKQQLQYDELERLIQTLLATKVGDSTKDNSVYESLPLINKMHCYINVAQDKLTNIAKHGMHIITQKIDPFCYGNECLNLIETIDLHYENSWGEQFVIHFHGDNSMSEAAISILELIKRQSKQPELNYYSFTSMRADEVVTRVKLFFRHLINAYSQNLEEPTKFIYRLGMRYHIIEQQNERFIVHKVNNEKELSRLLINQFSHYQNILFDPRCFTDPVIPTAIKKGEPGKNIFIVKKQHETLISFCFVDHFGGVVFGQMGVDSIEQNIMQVINFLTNSLDGFDTSNWFSYQLIDNERLTPIAIDFDEIAVSYELDIEIFSDEGKESILVYCRDQKYTFSLDDPNIGEKFLAWIDRAFNTAPEQFNISKLRLPVPMELLSEGRLLLERNQLYSLLFQQ
ncbi:class I adenylate cyclase [Pleionea litopenaei]|uniref:Class I adenylate cyclase n=1 Tax=Pleionea litopenaei TaxID=3070815 RepID=A0AA51X5S7_9GAMM|nr:class I adenylate cyclase [Pleionea sp. HL-JVS1]WMS86139.1 class I adenylate cyclase [Pleionea sp. HL-JVS1]